MDHYGQAARHGDESKKVLPLVDENSGFLHFLPRHVFSDLELEKNEFIQSNGRWFLQILGKASDVQFKADSSKVKKIESNICPTDFHVYQHLLVFIDAQHLLSDILPHRLQTLGGDWKFVKKPLKNSKSGAKTVFAVRKLFAQQWIWCKIKEENWLTR